MNPEHWIVYNTVTSEIYFEGTPNECYAWNKENGDDETDIGPYDEIF